MMTETKTEIEAGNVAPIEPVIVAEAVATVAPVAPIAAVSPASLTLAAQVNYYKTAHADAEKLAGMYAADVANLKDTIASKEHGIAVLHATCTKQAEEISALGESVKGFEATISNLNAKLFDAEKVVNLQAYRDVVPGIEAGNIQDGTTEKRSESYAERFAKLSGIEASQFYAKYKTQILRGE